MAKVVRRRYQGRRLIQGLWRDLERLGALSEKQLSTFMYHLNELLAFHARLKAKLQELRVAVKSAKKNSKPLWNTAGRLAGEPWEVGEHLKSIKRPLDRLQNSARALPPLNRLTDEQMHRFIIREAYSSTSKACGFPNAAAFKSYIRGHTAAAHGRKERKKGQGRTKGQKPVPKHGL